MSFEKNLLQMKKLIKKKPATKQSLAPFVVPQKPFYSKAWEDEGLTIVENKFGMVFKKKIVYSPEYLHGDFKLKEIFEAITLWNTF